MFPPSTITPSTSGRPTKGKTMGRTSVVPLLAVVALAGYADHCHAAGVTFTPLGTFSNFTDSHAYAMSADGSTVVGRAYIGVPGPFAAFRWNESTAMVGIGNESHTAYDVSADGSVVIGHLWGGSNSGFRWSEATGVVDLGHDSDATGISADGTVVAGTESMGVFMWTEAGGYIPISNSGGVFGLSGDGTVIVGGRGFSDGGPSHLGAFRWTSAQGFVELPGTLNCYAQAANYDGSIIIGGRAERIMVSAGPPTVGP